MPTSIDRDDAKQRIKETADIVQVIGEHVKLRKAGHNFVGLCPFHDDRKSPSLSVNVRGQFFHCFGCGESGDVFSFLMKYLRIDFPEALRQLAERYRIELPEAHLTPAEQERVRLRDRLREVNERAARIFSTCLFDDPGGQPARDYLARRAIPLEAARQYRLGYSPSPETGGWDFLLTRLAAQGIAAADAEAAGLAAANERGGHYDRFRDRVLFPILDNGGAIVAFGGRILGDGQPKYMNSPESPIFNKSSLLLGLHQHRDAIREARLALVVEGNFDLLALAVHGIGNVVAPLGTALTHAHVRLLKRHADRVVLLFDGDSAGVKAAMRAIPFFLQEQLDVAIATPPEGHDPDSLVREAGPDAVRALIAGASPLAEFAVDQLARRHGDSLEGKNRIVAELKPLIAAAEDEVQRSLLTSHFGERLGIRLDRLDRLVAPSAPQLPPRPSPPRPRPEDGAAIETLPLKHRQIVDFLLLFPEHLQSLLDAGMEKVLAGTRAMELVDCLRVLGKGKSHTAGDILVGLPAGSLRQYAAHCLSTKGGELEDDDNGGQHLDELLAWLQRLQVVSEGRDIEDRIRAAQEQGDLETVLRLLNRQLELNREEADFSDNALKKIY